MPLREYHCTHCKHRFEEIEKFSDPLLIECPQCGEDTLKTELHPGAFSLKGGGWYADGYASKKRETNSET